jgi:hypothetical protein
MRAIVNIAASIRTCTVSSPLSFADEPSDAKKVDATMVSLWKPIEKYIGTLNRRGSMPAVHHYTNVKGALGILESGRIWFTERAHLNDPSEVSHGISVAAAILREQGRNDDAGRIDGAAQEVFRDFRFFSASFSFEGDDLSQRRAYADDGKGVVLSFKASAFNNPKAHIDNFVPNNQTAFVCPMSYSSNELRSVITTIIEAWDGKNVGELCDHVFMISSMFKNDCWNPENEYRFFVHGNCHNVLKSSCCRFRERNTEIVCYLDVPIPNWTSMSDFPIYRIRLGPAASPDLEAQLNDFLSSRSIPIPREAISRSSLPYRSLRKI